MVVNLITFASTLMKPSAILSSHELLLSELEKHFTIRIVSHDKIGELTANDFSILFIASGGVERMVIQRFEELPRPIYLLADGLHNSLAAALEISAWIKTRGMKSEILHGELPVIIERINKLYQNFDAKRRLRGTKVGVIGSPSHWLVSSSADYLLTKRRWGVEFVDIPLEKVYEIYQRIETDDAISLSEEITAKALAIREGNQTEIRKAVKLYLAVKEICKNENLNAITLSCFKLIDQTETTGCLALSLLNDEGIIAGCEGDLQSVFTLLVAKILIGQEGFMANPSLIHVKQNEVVLAHCTIGMNQTEQFIIRSHFETEKGIAIQGVLPTGEITLFRCGGEALDEYYLSKGTLLENTNYINLCRTQVRVRLETPVTYFLKNPLGNHHILLRGDHANLLHEFMQSNSCKRAE